MGIDLSDGKKSEEERLKREEQVKFVEKEKERVRQAVINNDRMDYEMYLARKKEKERLAELSLSQTVVAKVEDVKAELHITPIKVEREILFSDNEMGESESHNSEVRISELHPFAIVGRLIGGGRNKKRHRQYEKETRVMDSILGGRKQSRVVHVAMSPNLPAAEKWVDLVRILKDEYHILLDETIELDTKGTVKIIMEFYSHIDQVLACKEPDAQPLRDVILPYVRLLEKQCAVRHIFRCRGKCLETYLLAEILPTEKCDLARAHTRVCGCTLRVRGINMLYGYAAEFSMNNESSRVQFLMDLNERFEIKSGKLQIKGVRQGFEFSQKNCFDLFCNETRLHDRGGSVLTSMRYVEIGEEEVVVEKVCAQVIICLAPGNYDFIAVPTAKKPNEKLIDYFDQLKTVRGAIEISAEIVDGTNKVYLTQRVSRRVPMATSAGILKLKTGRCRSVIESDEEDKYWLVAWRRMRNLAFTETKYISVLHCLLPRDDMKGHIATMKSKIDLNFCYESVPSCSNY